MYKGYPGIYILKIGESTKNPIAMINTYHTETNAVRQALSVINFSRSSSRGNNSGYIRYERALYFFRCIL